MKKYAKLKGESNKKLLYINIELLQREIIWLCTEWII